MKVTIYELLGMVKDGKAPKKIKFNNIYCYYRECKNEYVDFTNKSIIQWDYVVMNSLNDEVEIIEEPKEHKIPKKIQSNGESLYSEYIGQWLVNTEKYTEYDELLMNKINEILDYLEVNNDRKGS